MIHGIEDTTSIDVIAAESAAMFAGDHANAGLIREEIRVRAQAAYNEGRLTDDIPTPAQMFGDFVVRKADQSAKRRLAMLKRSLQHHQQVLDFGHEFDSITLVCGKAALGNGALFGRMTTLGLLTAEDLTLIGTESSVNRVTVVDADDQLQSGVLAAVPLLKRFRDYRTYCEQAMSA